MNTHQICIDSFFQNEEDVRAIEDAIKTAIKAVMYVLCGINDNRVREYKMLVSQKDRENERLRIQMESAERELISLRQYKRSMEHCSHVDVTCANDSGLSSEENSKQSVCAKVGLPDGEEDMHNESMWNKEFTSRCTGVSNPVERQRWETATDTSAIHGDDITMHNPDPASLPVKEEPEFETVCIKFEMCDQNVGEQGGTQGGTGWPPINTVPTCSRAGTGSGSPNHNFGVSVQPEQSVLLSTACQKTRLSNRERLHRYRARIRADPEKYKAYREMDRRRYQMRKKSIKDLPEQCQKLKREAWREAARRHRQRKKSHPQIDPHINQ